MVELLWTRNMSDAAAIPILFALRKRNGVVTVPGDNTWKKIE